MSEPPLLAKMTGAAYKVLQEHGLVVDPEKGSVTDYDYASDAVEKAVRAALTVLAIEVEVK